MVSCRVYAWSAEGSRVAVNLPRVVEKRGLFQEEVINSTCRRFLRVIISGYKELAKPLELPTVAVRRALRLARTFVTVLSPRNSRGHDQSAVHQI